ncbi:MAG: hypothetical protein DRP12_00800 [Candidatus Aenigmatarchaeota archaeon]|nr:MAG: hypothetical protein DRP12_00800 [Candidatus Aenigmarchaeota archaeon]
MADLEGIEIPKPPAPPKPKALPPAPPLPPAKPREPEVPEEFRIKGPAPPLFIKIDKYNEVVRNLNRLRDFTLKLRDALHTVASIERDLQESIESVHRALDRVNEALGSLDDLLLRAFKEKPASREELEAYVRELYQQMERIKSELKSI